MITGVDIVREQIYIASGIPLRLRQKNIEFRGHALECRVNAEDPHTFTPSPGRINEYHPPGGTGVRVDSHAYRGYVMSPFYDSLLAKLVTHGEDRSHAIARMKSAIREYIVDGISTNLELHNMLLADEKFAASDFGIRYLEERLQQQK
jgi:acetyl-CoA carboxylase biotin carboxylase subunit